MNRGRHVSAVPGPSSPPPLHTYVSVARALRRFSVISRPSAWSISPYRSAIVVPAGAVTFSSTIPAKFCPMSKMNTPGRISFTDFAASAIVTRTGWAA